MSEPIRERDAYIYTHRRCRAARLFGMLITPRPFMFARCRELIRDASRTVKVHWTTNQPVIARRHERASIITLNRRRQLGTVYLFIVRS